MAQILGLWMGRAIGNSMLRNALLITPALILVSALLTACGEQAQDTGQQTLAAREVSLAPASDVILPLRISAPADVLSPNESQLSADVTARVARVHADVGSTVKAGARLLELDATDYRLALAQAEARVNAAQSRVALAQRRLDRTRELLQQKFASEDEVLALQTELQSLQADVQVAEADRGVAERNVEKCLIRAPFDGVVVERSAQVGTLATAGSALLRLIDLSPPEVEAAVPSSDAASLSQASELSFVTQSKTYAVRLLRLAPVVDRAGRTRVARFAFVDDRATAGSSGTISWRASGQLLPASLLVKREQALGYFLADNGRAQFVAVPDAQEGRPFAADVPLQSVFVVRGQQGLKDGDAIVDATTKAASQNKVPAAAASTGAR
jgi:RND family efflux transporter MFP subunit